MSLAFVPLYIKFMGIESYGLVGIFVSIQLIFSLLDMGISTTLNRELARLLPLPDKAQEMRNLVRTLESVYWGVALIIAFAVVGLSSPIAHYWVKTVELPRSTVQQALMIMGGIMAFQFPLRFYSGGLMGIEKQVLLNCINVVAATLRGIGAVVILWQVSPTIQAFFTWQIFICFFNAFFLRAFLWRSLPKTGNPSHFQKNVIFHVWRFAAGISGISVASLIVTQTDKIVLSKTLTLEMFGYYILATGVAFTLINFVGPISSALFPRFSRLVSLHDQIGIKVLYHKGCQLVSVLILPTAIVVSLFSAEILLLWTGNPLIVKNSHVIVSLLIIGVAFNGLMYLPLSLQLSHGWTKLGLYSEIIAVIVFAPTIYFLSIYYGAVGAAVGCIILYGGYVLICIPVMHSRLLKGEQWRWFFKDVGVPLAAALTTALIWRICLPNEMSRYVMFASLAGVSITTLISSAIVTPYTRFLIGQILIKFKVPYKGKVVVQK